MLRRRYGVAKLRLPMAPRVRAMAESVLHERSEELGTTVRCARVGLHTTWRMGGMRSKPKFATNLSNLKT